LVRGLCKILHCLCKVSLHAFGIGILPP
jgi:hypothetical protein